MKAPAFQFYADDFLAGTLDLSQEELGAYIRLLCHQWNRGSIPVETEKQQRLAGGPVSADVLVKFQLMPDGRLVNERLEQEREKQANFREAQSKKGKASAEARRNQPESNRGSTAVQPRPQPDVQPNGNSPSPSPSPSSSKEEDIHSEKPAAPRKRDEVFDALARSEGSAPEQLTSSAAKSVGVACAQIRKACPDVTPEEIARRAAIYPTVMPQGTTLTASALAKHWARCDRPTVRAKQGELTVEDFR